MLKPLQMKHVCLAVSETDAPLAAYLLARYGEFSPERSLIRQFHAGIAQNRSYRDTYLAARRRLEDVSAHCQLQPSPTTAPSVPPSLEQLRAIDGWLKELLEVAHDCETTRQALDQETHRIAALRMNLQPCKALHVDLGQLLRPKRFLDTRIGTLPAAKLDALYGALEHSGVLLEVIGERDGQVTTLVVSSHDNGDQILDRLKPYGWKDVTPLPADYGSDPNKVEQRLSEQDSELAERSKGFFARHAATCRRIAPKLMDIRHALSLAEPYAMLCLDATSDAPGRRAISGWVPARNTRRLRNALTKNLKSRHALQEREPFPSEHELIPSQLEYPNWLRPFAQLVRDYGIPRYGEFDPTLLFALSFLLMFGMMFGDVGHGLVIAGMAAFLGPRRKRFRPLLVGAGAASAGFGLVYGSVFGLHTLISPLWIYPLHDPTRMLKVAVGWGVGFLCVTHVITIYNRLAAQRFEAALLDVGGAAGALLYLGGVIGLYRYFADGSFGTMPTLACLIGLAAVLVFKWREQPGTRLDRLAATLFSGLEAVISYFANTLSFMRVAAFSINHAALAMAVYTLAEGMNPGGRWLTYAIGNIAIIVVEGGIVAIQVVRLEYYEGFSRYFIGTGQEFKPIEQGATPAAAEGERDASRTQRL